MNRTKYVLEKADWKKRQKPAKEKWNTVTAVHHNTVQINTSYY